MKTMAFWGGILFLGLIFFVPMSASAMGIEAAVGIWRVDPSGDAGSKGESLSIENELKYDAKSRLFGRVKLDMPSLIPNIYLMATPVKFEEQGIKTAGFRFGDKTYAGNVPFFSTLKMNHYDVALFYSLPFLKTATRGVFNLEVGLNARIVDFKAEIKQAATGTEWVSVILPVPMVYLGAQLKPIKYLSLEAEARGVVYNENRHYDLIGRVKVQPFGPVFLSGGYRYEKAKIDQNDVKANITFDGPFLELGVVF